MQLAALGAASQYPADLSGEIDAGRRMNFQQVHAFNFHFRQSCGLNASKAARRLTQQINDFGKTKKANMMKAIVQDKYGSPDDVLELREIDKPVVGNDEVLLRVRAASVHPDVWHVVTGRPYILCLHHGRPAK